MRKLMPGVCLLLLLSAAACGGAAENDPAADQPAIEAGWKDVQAKLDDLDPGSYRTTVTLPGMTDSFVVQEGQYDVERALATGRVTYRDPETSKVALVVHYRLIGPDAYTRMEGANPIFRACWLHVNDALSEGGASLAMMDLTPAALRIARGGHLSKTGSDDDSLTVRAKAEYVFSTFGLRNDAFDSVPQTVLDARVPARMSLAAADQVLEVRTSGATTIASLPEGALTGQVAELLPMLTSVTTLSPLSDRLQVERPGSSELVGRQGDEMTPCAAAK